MREPGSVISERDVRQRALVPPERLARCDAVVIGVGAIGRQVAMQLAALGAPRLTLFDDSRVQVENLASEGYWPGDLNQPKVSATARFCRCIQPTMHVTALAQCFNRATWREGPIRREPIVFCCVDHIVTRRMIWETIRSSALLYIDGRIRAEVVRVIAVDDPFGDDSYAKTLPPVDEAQLGACCAPFTIYTHAIAAGLMVHQFAKWLRGLCVDPDLSLNLPAAEMTVS